jgi:hypothetical protein
MMRVQERRRARAPDSEATGRRTAGKHHFIHYMPPRPPIVPISVPPPAPDSPRSAQSVPPTGIQGDLEQDLMGLANALYNLGTTVVNDSTKDPGTGKQVGQRA